MHRYSGCRTPNFRQLPANWCAILFISILHTITFPSYSLDCDRSARSAKNKVKIIFLYREYGRNYCATASPERPISHVYVQQFVKFWEHKVLKTPWSGRQKIDDVTEMEIINRVNCRWSNNFVKTTSLKQLTMLLIMQYSQSNIPKNTIAKVF